MMKKTKILLAVIAAIAATLPASGQLMPVENIQAPDAAHLGTYGSVPVSLFTGVPEINIPIHEIKTGAYGMPVSISYHLASVRPHQQPGSLGVGWTLRAGGQITRTVRCEPDEKMNSNGGARGFYGHATEMAGITDTQFAAHTGGAFLDDFGHYELAADEFAFDFCGYTGNFYLNAQGGWTVVSDDDIKVEFNPSEGEGFIGLQQIRTRINTNNWTGNIRNNRFFNKFTLVTPDGCRYEFGGIQATEFSIPYYNRNNSDLIPTTWKLTKITTPSNRIITLTYDTDCLMCDIRYVPQYVNLYGAYTYITDPYNTGRKGYTGFLLFPVLLKTIETDSEKVTLDYESVSDYGDLFGESLYWSQRGQIRGPVYFIEQEDPVNQFFVFMGVGSLPGESDAVIRERISSTLKYKYLYRMAFESKLGDKPWSVFFKIRRFGKYKLERMEFREGIPAKTYTPQTHLPAIPENTSADNMPCYSFDYGAQMPVNCVMAKTDSWGYYTGESYPLSGTPAPTFGVVMPNLTYTKAETLTRIMWPTGAVTQFTYELNDCSATVGADHATVVPVPGISHVGGLRVKEINESDRYGNRSVCRKYHYSDTIGGQNSSGISAGTPPYELTYTAGGAYLELKSATGYRMHTTSHNTPDVGYSSVIEETLDGSGTSHGFTRYRFSNYGTDIHGVAHPDTAAYYQTPVGSSAAFPFTSRSHERGRLQSVERFDSLGRKLYEQRITYSPTAHADMVTAYQEAVIFPTDPNPSAAGAGWLTKTRTCSYLPTLVTESTYTPGIATPFTISKSVAYNSSRLVSSESSPMSDGTTHTVTYAYPADVAGCQWMVQRHLLNPPVTVTEQDGGLTRTVTNTYATTATGIPYLQDVATSYGGQYVRHCYTVHATDAYGNPQELTRDGLRTVLFWGKKGQRIMARVDNVTAEKANAAVSLDDFEMMREDDFYPFRYFGLMQQQYLPRVLVRLFLYDGLRLVGEMDPDGNNTLYKYDTFGRLRESYFYEDADDGQGTGDEKIRHILKRYDYQY